MTSKIQAIIPVSPAILLCWTYLYFQDEFQVHFELTAFCFPKSSPVITSVTATIFCIPWVSQIWS